MKCILLICVFPVFIMGGRITKQDIGDEEKGFYQPIFKGGMDNYHSYRIPAIVRTNRGTLIAFAEGRVNNRKDYGNIDLVFKRSSDQGKTWSSLGVIIGNSPSEKDLGTWGNPTPVVDRTNGKIWLFLCYNDKDHAQNEEPGYIKIGVGDRKVYVTSSDDDGLSWTAPVDVSSSTQSSSKTFDIVGPGVGIQTTVGQKNRLIIPAAGRNIYSDNGGKSWTYAPIPSGTGEGTIVELVDGKLMRNDRAVGSVWGKSKTRQVSVGSIEEGFSPFVGRDDLPDPRCQGSILRYGNTNRILFLNSASTSVRTRMVVKMSYDGGRSWLYERRLYDNFTEKEVRKLGKGGYSSMTDLDNNFVASLIETKNDISDKESSHSIEFNKFNISWVLNGKSEPK